MNRFFRIVALSLAVCTAAVCLSACKSNTPPVVEPFDDTPTTTAPTKPTVAVAETQLTLPLLFSMHGKTLPWSLFEPFDHEKTSDTTATFIVADTFGHECTLTVTIDPASGNLTAADLTGGELTVTLLDETSKGLMKMFRELNPPKE